MKNEGATIITVIALLVVFGLGFFFGSDFGEWRMRRQAVEDGKAEYYLDANHNKQWRWKEAK